MKKTNKNQVKQTKEYVKYLILLKIDSLPPDTGALYELKKNKSDLQEVLKIKYLKKT